MNGTKLWSNRPFYMKSIPSMLNEMQLLQLPHNSRHETNITIKVEKGTQMYVAANKSNISSEFIEQLEMERWSEISDPLYIHGLDEEFYNYTLWRKDFISMAMQNINLTPNETSIAIFIGRGKQLTIIENDFKTFRKN